MSLNLGDLLANSARRYGDETALITGDTRHPYEWLDDRVRAFAAELLAGGLQRDDKVMLMLPNGPAFTIAYFGVLYAGGVAVTVSTLQVADEVAYQLGDCDATVLVLHPDCFGSGVEAFARTEGCRTLYAVETDGTLPDGAKRFEDALAGSARADVCLTGSDDTAVILYTSGTTGHPKGAELTHFNLFYNAQLVNERIFSEWPARVKIMGPGDVAIGALPLYHIFGQTNVQNGMLFGGAALTYVGRFDPVEVVKTIARDKVTFFPGVPTMYFAILHDEEASKADLSSVRSCISGGAPIPVEVKRRFQEQFGVRIQEGYGLTETSPLAAVQAPSETEKAGTIGKPVDGVMIRIVDEKDQEVPQGERGEIAIRGHNIMKGYYKRPKATAEAFRGGWFHSGDIGYIDEEGDIFIVDRKKDMILRGGFNVYPREVEEILYTHPAIREAAVVGIPDEKLGEEVKAVVSLKSEATPESITEHCKKHLAAYKYPRVVEIIDELPKGSTGKILKRALRD